MTENEAIKHLQSYAEVVDNMIKYCKDFEPKADITGYLEKKTVFAMAISAIKEIQQYRKIGTVEECREAVEKQKAMKPKEILRHRGGFEIQHCPNCNMDYRVDRRYEITDGYCPVCGKLLDSVFKNYCANCGQAIENENLEEMENE